MHRFEQALSRTGFVFAEVIAAIPILGLLAALTATGVINYQRARHVAAARMGAAWATAAQLQRIQAGAPIDSAPPEGVISRDVQLTAAGVAGEGVWEGFQLVTVTGTVTINDREKITEKISGYVRTEGKP